MRLEPLHHRLVVGMGLTGVIAAWGGGVLAAPVALAGIAGLVFALFRRPSDGRVWLERLLIGVAAVLAARAGYLVAVSPEMRLTGMVDLLLLLLVAESWKPAERAKDTRLYVLSFALLVAATVFRPGLVFGLAFVAYLALSTVALMVGHLRRKILRYGAREVPVTTRFLLGTGALSLVTLVISVTVFLAFPRVSRGFATGGPSFATRIAGFADEVSLGAHGATIQANPDVVLRVEFPDGQPENVSGLHWRGRSYDRFDGVRWTHTDEMTRSGPSPEWYARRRPGRRVRQEVYGSLLDSRVLFALHPILDIDARSRIRPYVDRAGDVRFRGNVPPTYQAESVLDPPDPDALRTNGEGPAPAAERYLQLPELSPRVQALADSLTAGLDSRYDRARAIEDWLRSLRYTRELPATADQAGLEYFLFERQAGHCEYFSTAMVVLLRTVGIPARNVNGFLGGQWNGVGNHLAVTQNEAHSWVEVWHGDFGWVTYDPTPAGSAGIAGSSRPWFWPGRILFDGLQHRWNKWVLDYSFDNQAGAFRRAADLLEGSSRESRRDLRAPAWLWWLLGGGAALGLAWVLRGTRPSRTPETRLYLKLRRAYDDRVPDIPLGSPLTFVRALESGGVPGAGAAEALVARYVRLRFGTDDVSPSALDAMRHDLRTARRALRDG